MGDFGAVFYRGPSMLTGDAIVGIVTGLLGHSLNPKTGPMAQTWILRPDLPPMDAKRQNLDDAICGDCKLRGRDGIDSTCYVTVWLAPQNVYRSFHAGQYFEPTWEELALLLEHQHVRCGAYGDPVAIPFEVWSRMLSGVAGWVGYTHAWRSCDPRFRAIAMASVDTPEERDAARLDGWRTFRVRGQRDPLLDEEIVCPASNEAGHRTTCQRCQLCRGSSRIARSIAIVAHGKPGNLAAFYRRRFEEVVAR